MASVTIIAAEPGFVLHECVASTEDEPIFCDGPVLAWQIRRDGAAVEVTPIGLYGLPSAGEPECPGESYAVEGPDEKFDLCDAFPRKMFRRGGLEWNKEARAYFLAARKPPARAATK